MQPQIERTVVSLLWGSGELYSVEWVNRLYRGVQRHLKGPFKFVCFADTDKGFDKGIDVRDVESLTLDPSLREIWWKLAIMHPKAGLSGRCLFLDLDSVIVDDMEDFFQYRGEFCIIHNWIEKRKQILRSRPLIGNSSVFRFEAGAHPEVVDQFLRDPERVTSGQIFPTEQAFMTHAIGLDRVTWWPEHWVRSFKHHCLRPFPLNWWQAPRIPADASIVTFHGFPKPNDVIEGTSRHLRKKVLPMPELAEHWR